MRQGAQARPVTDAGDARELARGLLSEAMPRRWGHVQCKVLRARAKCIRSPRISSRLRPRDNRLLD